MNRQVFRCEKFAVLLTTGIVWHFVQSQMVEGGGKGGPHIVPKQQLVVEALHWGGDSSVGKASD